MVRIRSALAVCAFVGLLDLTTLRAETWPGWRGASGRSVSNETGLPTHWSATENVLWKAALRGKGNSSPAVTSRFAFVTSQGESDALWVICVRREDGSIAWEKQLPPADLIAYGPSNLYDYRHNPATPSPVADEEHVWAFFGTGLLVCFDHSGKEVWRKNLADEYGAYDLKFGMASSPRLWNGRLLVACVHKGPSYVLALDAKTGRELWLTPRNYPGLGDAPDTYSSPVILEGEDGQSQVVVSGCDHVDGYDVETGRRIWHSGGLLIPNEEYPRIIASPAVGEGIVVASAARGQQAIAIRGDGQGDVTESHRQWLTPRMTDCPSPTIHGGICYSVRDDGVATAFDLKSGEIVWRRRLGGNRYQASPVVGDGKVYFLSLDGKCTLIKEGTDPEVVAQNTIAGDFYATPAVSNGVIFLRDRSTLYAVGAAAPASDEKAPAKIEFEPVTDFLQIPNEIALGAVSGVGTDADGRIYVLHRGRRPVLCFDKEGKFLHSWGDDLIGSGHGLAVDRSGNVWVTDTAHHLVFKFSPEGKLLLALGQTDRPGPDENQFDKPTHVAFGPNDEIYVADGYGNARVVVFDSKGKFLRTWGRAGNGPGEFHAPHALIVEPERVLVADRDNNRIQIFTPEGELIATWAGFTPFGIARGPEGVVFVADGKANAVLQLDSRGKVVRTWGREGTGPGEFRTTHLMSCDERGNLYVAEVGGRRMQLLKRQGTK